MGLCLHAIYKALSDRASKMYLFLSVSIWLGVHPLLINDGTLSLSLFLLATVNTRESNVAFFYFCGCKKLFLNIPCVTLNFILNCIFA